MHVWQMCDDIWGTRVNGPGNACEDALLSLSRIKLKITLVNRRILSELKSN